jgi:SAM-dependent methyltransferase
MTTPTGTAPAAANLSRQYVKLCDRRDFDDPALRAKLREMIAPGRPTEEELHRKFWEYAMLGLYLEEVGILREDAEALSVAAGHEEPLYWLANRIGRVLATDIYGDGGFAHREAEASMVRDPSAFAPYEYRKDRFEARHMNALELELPDESFDIVFSLSSIEHFGPPEQIQQAASEMARVLRPGGHLIIVTECTVGRHFLDPPLVQYAINRLTLGRRAPGATRKQRLLQVFDPREVMRDVVAPTGLQLVQPMDLEVSPETYDNLITWKDAGDLFPKTGNAFPHIILKASGSPWTSLFLAFHKPARVGGARRWHACTR